MASSRKFILTGTLSDAGSRETEKDYFINVKLSSLKGKTLKISGENGSAIYVSDCPTSKGSLRVSLNKRTKFKSSKDIGDVDGLKHGTVPKWGEPAEAD